MVIKMVRCIYLSPDPKKTQSKFQIVQYDNLTGERRVTNLLISYAPNKLHPGVSETVALIADANWMHAGDCIAGGSGETRDSCVGDIFSQIRSFEEAYGTEVFWESYMQRLNREYAEADEDDEGY